MALEEVLLSIDFSLERIADHLEELMRSRGETPTATAEPQMKPVATEPLLYDNRGRPKGTIPKCSRCRRDGRSTSPKRNGRCIECEYEEWWTE